MNGLVMHERLAPLCLLPPATDMPWTGITWTADPTQAAGDHGAITSLKLPLFWYAPDWYLVSAALAAELAQSVSRLGVVVSALRSEIATSEGDGSPPAGATGAAAGAGNQGDRASPPWLRMLPYRSERYGLVAEDFDDAAIIDVRLAIARDGYGRFAYPPAQIQRWEQTPDDAPLAGGSWLPAATFPPDVASLKDLRRKLDQLRILAPAAAIFVSISPVRLDDELPHIVAAQPDGVILRLDHLHVEGLPLASLVRRTRKLLDRLASKKLPLWIVPGSISPTDVVKLLELGASAVAIDAWCNPLRDHAVQIRPPSSFSYATSGGSFADKVDAYVRDQLVDALETVRGLTLSIQRLPPGERLGSFSAAWSKTLGVRPIG